MRQKDTHWETYFEPVVPWAGIGVHRPFLTKTVVPVVIRTHGITRTGGTTATGGSIFAISAGNFHTCAVVNGGVQCWGWNGDGELGSNSGLNNSLVPVQVQGLTSGVTAIAAGGQHTCAMVNVTAYCWGANQNGELGNGTTISSSVPVTRLVPHLATMARAIASLWRCTRPALERVPTSA